VLVRGDTASALNISLGSVQVSWQGSSPVELLLISEISTSCQHVRTGCGVEAAACSTSSTEWCLNCMMCLDLFYAYNVMPQCIQLIQHTLVYLCCVQVLAVQQIGSRQLLVNVSAALPVSTDQAATQQDLSAGAGGARAGMFAASARMRSAGRVDWTQQRHVRLGGVSMTSQGLSVA